jgi:O-antigen/teichoic acid export membrane protein
MSDDSNAPPTQVAGPTGFFRNAMTLMTGTSLSQAVVFALSPVLSRLYDPEDFGRFANYSAWVTVLALVSNLRYEHAIIVARGRSGINRVVALALLLSFGICLTALLLAVALLQVAPDAKYLREVRPILLFIPAGAFSAAIVSMLTLINTRTGRFRMVAALGVCQVLLTVAAQLLLGARHVPDGLVIGWIIGSVGTGIVFLVAYFQRTATRHVTREMTAERLRDTAREHAKFPRYSFPADGVAVVSQQCAPVIITAVFGPATAGLFAFTLRVIRAPALIVSGAFASIMRKEAGDRFRRGISLWTLLRNVRGLLLAMGVVPIGILMIFAEPIIDLLFGANWIEAAPVLRALGPGILLEFVAIPLAVVFLVTNRQHYALWLQLVNLGLMALAIWVGKAHTGTFVGTCRYIGAAMIVGNLASILLSARIARIAPAPVNTETSNAALHS